MLMYQVIQTLPKDLLHLALQPFVEVAWDHTHLFRPSSDLILTFIPSLLVPPKYKDHSWHPSSPAMDDVGDGQDWIDYANPAQEILFAFASAYPAVVRSWDDGRLVRGFVPMLVGRLVAELIWEGDDQSDWLKEEDVSCTRRFGS